MKPTPLLPLLLALVAALTLSCASNEPKEAEMAQSSEKMMMAAPPAMDGLTGELLWSYLKEADYTGWKMWPGKEALYEGTEPHGMLLTTYVNGPALSAATEKSGMPGGAIVVKENYKPDKTLAAVTVMYKVEGYNPEAGDWFWVKYGADGSVAKEGKVAGCIKCHGEQAANDYIFLGPVK